MLKASRVLDPGGVAGYGSDQTIKGPDPDPKIKSPDPGFFQMRTRKKIPGSGSDLRKFSEYFKVVLLN